MPKYHFWFEGVVDAPNEYEAKYFVATLGQTDPDYRESKLDHSATKIQVKEEELD